MELQILESPPDLKPLLGMTRAELEDALVDLGEPRYRGRQLAAGLYRRRVHGLEELTDLPVSLRKRLGERYHLGRALVAGQQASRDGTVKLLLELADERRIETVMLPYADRTSVCVSTQVGCPVGCVFCATATMRFGRNLTAGEIVDQVLTAADLAPGGKITHVVVMGMGEPMLNYDSLVKALRLLHEEVGLSYRHLTVSTAGHVPGILRLADEGIPVTLALSLHAPNDPLRETLIPMSRKWGVEEVMEAVATYTEKTGRRVTLEYLLLAGVNDEPEHARQLARLVHRPGRELIAHVNLIPWNPAESFSRFEAPSRERVRAFRETLERGGVTVTQRMERGQDIDAACGQLALKGKRV